MALHHLFLALFANAAWAFNFIVVKAGAEHFQPLLFTALRFTMLLLIAAPFLRWVPGQMMRVIQVAIVLGVFHFSLFIAGIAASGDISSVAIITQLYVPFSALLAVLMLGETLGPRRLAGICVAFAGVLVIGFDPIVLQHPDALVLLIGAATAMAVATILMRQLKGVGVFTLQAWIAMIATPCLFVLSLLFEQDQWSAVETATWLEWASPAYAAIGASLLGHGIVYYLLGRYPVSVTAPIMLLTPVLAIVFGVTLWGDVLTWKLVLGGIMTIAGVGIINLRGFKSGFPFDKRLEKTASPTAG